MGRPTNSKWNSNWKDAKTQILDVPEIITNRTIEAMLVAAKNVALIIFEKADARVPEDDGDLRDSGRITEARQVGRNSVEIEIAYGNEIANYAFFVHEDYPNPGSPKVYTRPGSWPGYLRDAGDEVIGNPSIIKEEFRKAMKTMNGR